MPEPPKQHDIFISHASEDKSDFVRPLAERLRACGYSVWYDEFSLKLGRSLRRSIDRGLADSRFGVVVLSSNFFKKKWPQHELDGLVQKEAANPQVILPIWHNVDHQDVASYSPPLADRVAAKSADGLGAVVREIEKAVGPPTGGATTAPDGRKHRRALLGALGSALAAIGAYLGLRNVSTPSSEDSTAKALVILDLAETTSDAIEAYCLLRELDGLPEPPGGTERARRVILRHNPPLSRVPAEKVAFSLARTVVFAIASDNTLRCQPIDGSGDPTTISTTGPSSPTDVAYSPGGSYLLTLHQSGVAVRNPDSPAHALAFVTGIPFPASEYSWPRKATCYSRPGRATCCWRHEDDISAVASQSQVCVFADAYTRRIGSIPLEEKLWDMSFHNDGQAFSILTRNSGRGGFTCRLAEISENSLKVTRTTKALCAVVSSLGSFALIEQADGVALWDLRHSTPAFVFPNDALLARTLISPDGSHVLTYSHYADHIDTEWYNDYVVYSQAGNRVFEEKMFDYDGGPCFSPDGSILVVTANDIPSMPSTHAVVVGSRLPQKTAAIIRNANGRVLFSDDWRRFCVNGEVAYTYPDAQEIPLQEFPDGTRSCKGGFIWNHKRPTNSEVAKIGWDMIPDFVSRLTTICLTPEQRMRLLGETRFESVKKCTECAARFGRSTP